MNNSNNPGCFGFAVTHDPESAVCQQCNHAQECDVAASEARERIGTLIGYTIQPPARSKRGDAVSQSLTSRRNAA